MSDLIFSMCCENCNILLTMCQLGRQARIVFSLVWGYTVRGSVFAWMGRRLGLENWVGGLGKAMSPGKPIVLTSCVLCLLATLVAGCQLSPWAPTPTLLPPTFTPTPEPLTEAEAVALVTEELAARDVDAASIRVTIKPESRTGAVRFTSSYDWTSSQYNAQATIATLLISRAMLRVKPPVDGGLQISIIPQGDEEVGLHVISIRGSSLQAWADGSLIDQEYVASWTIGVMTKE